MKIQFKYIIVGVLCIFILAINSCSSKKSDKLTFEDNYEQILESKIITLEKENINSKLRNQCLFIGNDSLNKKTLKNFTTQKKLFFYFSENTCTPCIDETIEIIEKVFPSYIHNERIVFISPDYPERFREDFHKKKLLTLEHHKLGIPLEITEVPFFFVLNNKLEIESIHIINKTKFFKTEEYLRKISQKLEFR